MTKFFAIAGLLLTLGLPFTASANTIALVDWQTAQQPHPVPTTPSP